MNLLLSHTPLDWFLIIIINGCSKTQNNNPHTLSVSNVAVVFRRYLELTVVWQKRCNKILPNYRQFQISTKHSNSWYGKHIIAVVWYFWRLLKLILSCSCLLLQVPGLVPGLHGRCAAPPSAPLSALTAHVRWGRARVQAVLCQNGKSHIISVYWGELSHSGASLSQWVSITWSSRWASASNLMVSCVAIVYGSMLWVWRVTVLKWWTKRFHSVFLVNQKCLSRIIITTLAYWTCKLSVASILLLATVAC